ncbi:MAG: YdcF family protein [Clostridia bacterium]|nr:YdcF family protein [Clostridia bacterium]
MKRKISIRTAVILLLCALLIGLSVLLTVSTWVKYATAPQILTPEEAALVADADCVLVLGCYVQPDGAPSPLLQDRIEMGVGVYKLGAASKLLMSGDHGQPEYNEVEAMKRYAMQMGVPAEDIFMDHAGFCTYDSMYRAKEVFGAKKIVIVTQEYHLYRALYIANALELEAYGVVASPRSGGQFQRDVREVLARNKDVLWCALRMKPKYLGDPIDLTGDGRVTNG